MQWCQHVARNVLSCSKPSSTGELARKGGSSYSQSEGSRQPIEGAKGRWKLLEPDYDAIEDPRERQRQARLARIRASAAVARCVFCPIMKYRNLYCDLMCNSCCSMSYNPCNQQRVHVC